MQHEAASRLVNTRGLARAVRRRRGRKTQFQIAVETGICQATLSRIERGQSRPDIETYVRLCAWLGVSLDAFITVPLGEALGEAA